MKLFWPVHQVDSFWPTFVYWDIKLNAHPQMPPQIGTEAIYMCGHFKSKDIFSFINIGFIKVLKEEAACSNIHCTLPIELSKMWRRLSNGCAPKRPHALWSMWSIFIESLRKARVSVKSNPKSRLKRTLPPPQHIAAHNACSWIIIGKDLKDWSNQLSWVFQIRSRLETAWVCKTSETALRIGRRQCYI